MPPGQDAPAPAVGATEMNLSTSHAKNSGDGVTDDWSRIHNLEHWILGHARRLQAQMEH